METVEVAADRDPLYSSLDPDGHGHRVPPHREPHPLVRLPCAADDVFTHCDDPLVTLLARQSHRARQVAEAKTDSIESVDLEDIVERLDGVYVLDLDEDEDLLVCVGQIFGVG